MKKIVCIIMAVICVMVTPVFATEHTAMYDGQTGFTENGGETTLTYDVPDSYMISIPASITVGDDLQVYGQDVNLSNGKVIKVGYQSANSDGDRIVLENETGDKIYATFEYDEGIVMPQNGTIGELRGSGDTVNIHTVVQGTTGAKAGTYTGSVSFMFDIVSE